MLIIIGLVCIAIGVWACFCVEAKLDEKDERILDKDIKN